MRVANSSQIPQSETGAQRFVRLLCLSFGGMV